MSETSPGASRPESPIAGRRLYLCTSDRPDLAAFATECIRGGVDIVQLRDKHLGARALIARGRLLAEICGEYGVPFIMNDRPDLALEVGAAGVHIGQDDAPPKLVRRLLGERAVIGLSTHAPSELDDALGEPIDYLSAGPVVPTPTKPGRPGTGLTYIQTAAESAARCGLACFVTGGVSPATVPELANAGARGFVVVRYLTEAARPFEAARRLADAIAVAIA